MGLYKKDSELLSFAAIQSQSREHFSSSIEISQYRDADLPLRLLFGIQPKTPGTVKVWKAKSHYVKGLSGSARAVIDNVLVEGKFIWEARFFIFTLREADRKYFL